MTDDFVFVAHSQFVIPDGQGGDWTFQVAYDDSFELMIRGAAFHSTSRNAPGARHAITPYGSFIQPGLGAETLALATVNLVPGVYDLELLSADHSGGGSIELSAARGLKTAVDGDFSLVGAPAIDVQGATPIIRQSTGTLLHRTRPEATGPIETLTAAKSALAAPQPGDSQLPFPFAVNIDSRNGANLRALGRYTRNLSGTFLNSTHAAVKSNAILHVETPGIYTFGMDLSDGGELTILGAQFFHSIGDAIIRNAGQSVSLESSDHLNLTLAMVQLAAGDYPLEFITFNHLDAMSAELFVAPGFVDFFDSNAFALVSPVPTIIDYHRRAGIKLVTPAIRWNVDADGNWSAAANWTGPVPNSAGAAALFGDIITAPRTVTVDGAKTIGKLTFDNSQSYTLGGPSPLTITGGGASIETVRGSHTISAPLTFAAGTTVTKSGAGTLTISGAQTHGAGAVFVASAGVTNFNSDGGPNLSVQANAQFNIGSTQHLGGVQIGAGATALLTSGASKTLVTPTLTIAGTPAAPTGKFDVSSNSAIVDYTGASPATTIRQQILAGRGAAGLGAPWNGMGITSGAAASANGTDPESRSVGYANNAEMPLGPYSNFRDQPVDATSVLIAYTCTGDANLDGVVNDDDVTILGARYSPGIPQTAWGLGDFDYNGFVDDDDVTLLGAFYDPSAPPVAAPIGDVAAVPEPRTIVLMVLGLSGALALARDKLRCGRFWKRNG